MNIISLADPLSKSLEDKNTIKEKGQELKTHFTWTGNIEWVAPRIEPGEKVAKRFLKIDLF